MSYYKMNLTQPATAGVTWGSGNVNTNSSQPAFSAYPSADLTNVTGDGTIYTCVLNTAPVNRGTNYNTGTGVWTAPVTGLYQFTAALSTSGFTVSHTAYAFLFSYNGTLDAVYQVNPLPILPANPILTLTTSITQQMTAGDTMSLILYTGSGTKVVSIQGGNANTRFSGFLVS